MLYGGGGHGIRYSQRVIVYRTGIIWYERRGLCRPLIVLMPKQALPNPSAVSVCIWFYLMLHDSTAAGPYVP